jgi:hypothetical protein
VISPGYLVENSLLMGGIAREWGGGSSDIGMVKFRGGQNYGVNYEFLILNYCGNACAFFFITLNATPTAIFIGGCVCFGIHGGVN